MKLELGDAHVGREERRSSLTLWLLVLFLGSAALGAWFLIGPALGPGWYYKPGFRRSAYAYSPFLLALFVPYAMALWAWRRGSRTSLWVVVGGGIVLHMIVLFAPLPQSQDFYQYLFYGRMKAHFGANPFVANPSTYSGDHWYLWIKWFRQPSVYGPAWTSVSVVASKIAGDSLAVAFVSLKLVVLALDIAVMALIGAVARSWRRGPHARTWGVLAYAWNPMVLVAVPLAGSADIGVAAAVLGAILARRRERLWLTTLLLAGATLIKAYAGIALLLHLVLLMRERGIRRAIGNGALALGLTGLAYAPYWAGAATFSGLIRSSILTNASLMGTLYRLMYAGLLRVGMPGAEAVAGITVRVIGGAIFLAALVWAIGRVRDESSLWYATVFALLAYLLFSPWFLYWYLLAPLAMVAALPTMSLTYPVITFSGTALALVDFSPRLFGWVVQATVRYGPPAIVMAAQREAHRLRGAPGGGGRLEMEVPTVSGVRRRAASAE